MPRILITDLDNCISDDKWRRDRILSEQAQAAIENPPYNRFHEYHSLAAFDKMGNENFFKPLLAEDYDLLCVFTSRPRMFQSMTDEWLSRNNVWADRLYMRDDDDDRPPVELKRKMLGQLMDEWKAISKSIRIEAFDDDREIVQMYHDAGVDFALRVSIS